MYRVICILALASLISCTSADDPQTHAFRIYEEDGITIAESNGVPKYQGELFHYEKVVEIRSDTTNQDAILYRPFGFTVDDEGLIYVADSSNHRIAVFNDRGKYLRSIGREGDGPGEFKYPMSLKLINGKLQIPSGRQSRTTIYNTDGTLEDIVTYNMARSGSFVASALIAQNGTLIIQRMLENRGVQFVEQSQGFSTMTPEGDTLAIISTPYIRTMERTERGDIPLRFGPLPRVTFAPNRGIYLTTGLPPEIDWYNLDGRLIRKIKILFVSQSVSVADREKVKDYFNDQISEAGAQVQSEFSGQLSAEFLESQRDNSRFAELKAHWMNIQVDDNGYIWLQKYETAGAYTFSTQIREYYVLSPEGEFLGSTSIPEVDFATFGDRYVLASITEQTTGEMIPTLFRIMSNAAGFKYP